MPKNVLLINLAVKFEHFQINLENITADVCN